MNYEEGRKVVGSKQKALGINRRTAVLSLTVSLPAGEVSIVGFAVMHASYGEGLCLLLTAFGCNVSIQDCLAFKSACAVARSCRPRRQKDLPDREP